MVVPELGVLLLTETVKTVNLFLSNTLDRRLKFQIPQYCSQVLHRDWAPRQHSRACTLTRHCNPTRRTSVLAVDALEAILGTGQTSRQSRQGWVAYCPEAFHVTKSSTSDPKLSIL